MKIRFYAVLRFLVSIFITIIVMSFYGCGEDEFDSDIITEEEFSKIDESVTDLKPLFDNISLDADNSDKSDDNGSRFDNVNKNDTVDDKTEETFISQKDTTEGSYVVSENTGVKVAVTGDDNKDTPNSSTSNTGKSNKSESINYDSTEIIADTDNKETITYILNKNTKKFHYQSCSSASEIKPKNKDVGYDRDDILNRGFVPCKRCKP